MTIAAGETILAADINGIKDDVDAITSASTAQVLTSETTSSTSYANLSTTGPSVTLTTGAKVKVTLTARMRNDTAGQSCAMSVDVSGASTSSASDNRCVWYESGSANDQARMSAVIMYTGLNDGSHTFTAKYRVTGGTGTFDIRDIVVEPLGD